MFVFVDFLGPEHVCICLFCVLLIVGSESSARLSQLDSNRFYRFQVQAKTSVQLGTLSDLQTIETRSVDVIVQTGVSPCLLTYLPTVFNNDSCILCNLTTY